MRKSIIVYLENSSKAERQINSVLNEGYTLLYKREISHKRTQIVFEKGTDKYAPNGGEGKDGILHLSSGFYVTNEGTESKPFFHVWIPGLTHASCDSAYSDLSLAVARCNYLAENVH